MHLVDFCRKMRQKVKKNNHTLVCFFALPLSVLSDEGKQMKRFSYENVGILRLDSHRSC